MKTPEVSVIIPTYNHGHFVGETVQSVLDQTFTDYEIIVVDDGSTDNTREVLSQFGDKVRCIAKSHNEGLWNARNTGIIASCGSCLLFLDSDDLLMPSSLWALSQALDGHSDVGVAYSDGFYCDEEGRELYRLSKFYEPASGNVLDRMVLENLVTAIHSAMVRRACLDALDYWFDQTLGRVADWDLWIRLAEQFRFLYLDVPTCKYRVHAANMSRRYEQNWKESRAYQYRVLESPYFSRLAIGTKVAFFHRFLLYHLRDETSAQDQILAMPSFASIPLRSQAALLYYLAIDDVLHNKIALGRKRLRQAIALAPRNLKYRLVWMVAISSTSALVTLITLRRRLFRKKPLLSPFDSRSW